MNDGISWDDVWERTAAQLDQHRVTGLAHLLIEDVVRFATIQQLVSAGVSPTKIEAEWRRPGVPDAVDLVVSGPPSAAIEFKYPREPRVTNAAWTQHLGEASKDFYRLAHMPTEFTERWVRSAALGSDAALPRRCRRPARCPLRAHSRRLNIA